MQISVTDYRLEILLSRLYELAAQFDIMPDIPLETSLMLSNLPVLLKKAATAMQKAVSLYKDDYGDGIIKEMIKVYEPGLPSAFYHYEDLYQAAANSFALEWNDTYEYLSDPDNLCELVPQAYKETVREYFKKLSYQDSYGIVNYYELQLALPFCPEVIDYFYNREIDMDVLSEQMKDFIVELLELLTGALEELGAGEDINTIRANLSRRLWSLLQKCNEYADLIDVMAMLDYNHTHIYDLSYDLSTEGALTSAEEIVNAILDCTFSFLTDLVRCLVEWEADASWFVKECNLCFKAMNELCEVIEKQFNAISKWSEDEENWRDFIEECFPEYYDEIYGMTGADENIAAASTI